MVSKAAAAAAAARCRQPPVSLPSCQPARHCTVAVRRPLRLSSGRKGRCAGWPGCSRVVDAVASAIAAAGSVCDLKYRLQVAANRSRRS